MNKLRRKKPPTRWQPNETAYLSALPASLIAVDRRLHITFFNQAAETLFAQGASQALGKSVVKALPFLSEMQLLFQRVLDSGEEIRLYEDTLALPPGTIKATLYLTPVLDDLGRVTEVLLTIEKSDGLPTLTASEWKKDSTRAAGLMAAMFAHEVKNPLSGISGAAQILKDEASREHRPLAELICREADRIRDLLAQMEIFTDRAPPVMQPVNIHEVLQYVIAIAHSGFARHVAVKEQYDPSLPPVLGQRELLVQLFLNLVKNAAEAVENQKNATLTITTGYKSGYRLPQPLPVVVSIEDNGRGIPDTLRDKLFEPFFTSKGEGRGLGLAVVAKIAADLGAVVELDAAFSGGARFNIMLPLASDKSATAD